LFKFSHQFKCSLLLVAGYGVYGMRYAVCGKNTEYRVEGCWLSHLVSSSFRSPRLLNASRLGLVVFVSEIPDPLPYKQNSNESDQNENPGPCLCITQKQVTQEYQCKPFENVKKQFFIFHFTFKNNTVEEGSDKVYQGVAAFIAQQEGFCYLNIDFLS